MARKEIPSAYSVLRGYSIKVRLARLPKIMYIEGIPHRLFLMKGMRV
ncbi:MAG: hypothetical protein OEX77_08650 [Candidatus Bathyarchaeota archaeon]|nr:hypothetical protein [Candidatus Bathyarchaeota archaeon]MDH5734231.1 hypothetical protein [Candidatus Bathyarchaeota archaeon]